VICSANFTGEVGFLLFTWKYTVVIRRNLM
jgi:hypothetical protein